MADFWMDVDAALAEVPVNILPLIDSGDFITILDSVAYNAAGMDLVWNFVTTAGAMTQTAVTPTTAGTYDWTIQGNGMYSIEIPASGGGSINNDTEGFGWFTGVATGVLPWRGPTIGFRAAGLNNKLIDSAYSATEGLAGTNLDAAVSTRSTYAGGAVASVTAPVTLAAGQITVKKNTALANFEFVMYQSGDHVTPATGLTITSTRSIDGGALLAAANVATEVGGGVYKINLAAADLNGNVIMFRFAATGADATFAEFLTQA